VTDDGAGSFIAKILPPHGCTPNQTQLVPGMPQSSLLRLGTRHEKVIANLGAYCAVEIPGAG
jgi:hypothetical protein